MLTAPESDSGITEADDVCSAITCQVGEETRMVVDTPAPGISFIELPFRVLALATNRLKKTLGFATPNEVFFNDINNKDTVALAI